MFNVGGLLRSGKNKGYAAGVLLVLTPIVAQFEGLRTKTYLDAVGIPTVCYGETQGVSMGQVESKESCDKMLAMRLAYFYQRVDYLIVPEISKEEMAAYSSLAYNIGVGAFEKSTLLRLLNSGQRIAACNELLRWNKAGGQILRGLVVRREKERDLCLSGL